MQKEIKMQDEGERFTYTQDRDKGTCDGTIHVLHTMAVPSIRKTNESVSLLRPNITLQRHERRNTPLREITAANDGFRDTCSDDQFSVRNQLLGARMRKLSLRFR